MNCATDLARLSFIMNEVPVGAIIVDNNNNIIGHGFNLCISTNDPTAHAEIIAIKEACKNLKNWRLDNCTLYTSLEPCIMCLGAIMYSRIKKVYFGLHDHKQGGLSTNTIIPHPIHKTIFIYLENIESKKLIKLFFNNLRAINKKEKKINNLLIMD